MTDFGQKQLAINETSANKKKEKQEGQYFNLNLKRIQVYLINIYSLKKQTE